MREILYRDAIIEALDEEMKRDNSVFLLGEDIAEFGGSYNTTTGLFKKYGKEELNRVGNKKRF